jgi:dethiobiotin synthetase
MSAYLVTATGTDIGKTFVTAGLIRHLRANGRAVSALKPIVSGYADATAATSDPGVLLAALGEDVTPQALARLSPWRFAAPLSPDMAAAREGRAIDFAALLDVCRAAVAENRGTLFIEGVGGVMVPLDDTRTVLDWAAALGLPLILVTGSYLGTLSHTLTALRVIAAAGLEVAALVVNESDGATVPLDETAAALTRFAPGVRIVTLARNAGDTALARLAAVLG